MKIFISIGHNNAFNFIDDHGKIRFSLYRDRGAVGGDSDEYNYGNKICSDLISKYPMAEYVFVPRKLNLHQRIKWVNDNCIDGDMCIEIHMDSFNKETAEGCSTWYMSGSKYAGNKATVFQREYTRITGIKGRGVHGDLTNRNKRLGFVRDTKCLAFLLEMGFITNEGDRNKVWTKGAEGIFSGLNLILEK